MHAWAGRQQSINLTRQRFNISIDRVGGDLYRQVGKKNTKLVYSHVQSAKDIGHSCRLVDLTRLATT